MKNDRFPAFALFSFDADILKIAHFVDIFHVFGQFAGTQNIACFHPYHPFNGIRFDSLISGDPDVCNQLPAEQLPSQFFC